MGVVYMAEQREPVRRSVALKIIKPGMDSKAVLARFEAERQALAMMDHPNIARVLDAGSTESGRPFFVMELVKGVPITEYCDQRRLTLRERLELFLPVCEAIQHAHQKGVIHRDIKPSNVLVALYDDKPVPKVIDFGVAKATGQALTEKTLLTGFGTLVGTPEYMSPEQAELNNQDIDTRSDVYSLGVLLYELLTGSTPLDRKSLGQAAVLEVLRAVREVEAPRPSAKLSSSEALPSIAASRNLEPARLTKLLEGELDWVLLKALEKDRRRRYETANGLARDLEHYLADEVVEARPPTSGYRLRKFVRRHKGQVIAAGLVLLALLAGVTGTTLGLIRAEQQQRRAETGEKLAGQRLIQVEEEKKQVEGEKTEAEREKLIAQSVRDFLQNKLLSQADAWVQADTLLEAGRSSSEAKLNPTIRELGPRGARIGPGQDRSEFPQAAAGAGRVAENGGQYVSWSRRLRPRDSVPDSRRRDLEDLFRGQSPRHPLCVRQPGRDVQVGRQRAEGDRTAGICAGRAEDATGARSPGRAQHAQQSGPGIPVGRQADTSDRALRAGRDARVKKLGAGHPDTLSTLNDLAWAYHYTGKLPQAIALFEQVRDARVKELGADHPATLATLNDLAHAYGDDGKYPQAIELLEQVRDVQVQKLGAKHPDTLVTLHNLAIAYRLAGKLAQAIELLEQVREVQVNKYGVDHPDTIRTLYALARAHKAAGNLRQALPLFEQAAAGIENRNYLHEFSAAIIPNTIRAYEAARQFDKAVAWRRKWLAVVKQKYGMVSAAYAEELVSLGQDLFWQQKYADAEPILREFLDLREKLEEKKQTSPWLAGNARSMLGEVLLQQKKPADAEPLLVAAYEDLKRDKDAIPEEVRDERMTEAVQRLIELAAATHKRGDVEKWQAELANYPSQKPPGKTALPAELLRLVGPDGKWELPPNAPAPAVAPFDAAGAKGCQAVWARRLGVPVEISNSLGMRLVLIPPGEFEMGSPKELIQEQLHVHEENDWYRGWYRQLLAGEGPGAPCADHKTVLAGGNGGNAGRLRAGDGQQSELFQGRPKTAGGAGVVGRRHGILPAAVGAFRGRGGQVAL